MSKPILYFIPNEPFTLYNEISRKSLMEKKEMYLNGYLSQSSSIKNYFNNNLHDINCDKIIFSYLDDHLDTNDQFYSEEKLLLNFIWDKYTQDNDYIKKICEETNNLEYCNKFHVTDFISLKWLIYGGNSLYDRFSDMEKYVLLYNALLSKLKNTKYGNFLFWFSELEYECDIRIEKKKSDNKRYITAKLKEYPKLKEYRDFIYFAEKKDFD